MACTVQDKDTVVLLGEVGALGAQMDMVPPCTASWWGRQRAVQAEQGRDEEQKEGETHGKV